MEMMKLNTYKYADNGLFFIFPLILQSGNRNGFLFYLQNH